MQVKRPEPCFAVAWMWCIMCRMERDWARLGSAMAGARRSKGLSQVEVAEAIGVTRTPIQAIERGETFARVTGTMRSYARHLGWADGSIEAVLAGGDPTPEAQALRPEQTEPTVNAPTLTPQLPLRIVQELSAESGPVLDTTVLDLPGATPGSRMIVVIKGAPDASPEQIRADLLAWDLEQRRLRGLTSDQDTTSGAQGA